MQVGRLSSSIAIHAKMRADLIVVLKDGEVAEQGSHQELLSRTDGVYAHLWRNQSQEATMESILDGRGQDHTANVKEIV